MDYKGRYIDLAGICTWHAFSGSTGATVRLEGRTRLQPMAHDLLAGRKPHTGMRADVTERIVEPGEAVPDVAQIRVQVKRQHAARSRTFVIEGGELVAEHL